MSMLQFARHAGRYREMLSVLVKFGFREFFEDAKLDLLLEPLEVLGELQQVLRVLQLLLLLCQPALHRRHQLYPPF